MEYGNIIKASLVIIILCVYLFVSWKSRCVYYFGQAVKPCKRDESPANFYVAILFLAFCILFLLVFGVIRPVLDVVVNLMIAERPYQWDIFWGGRPRGRTLRVPPREP